MFHVKRRKSILACGGSGTDLNKCGVSPNNVERLKLINSRIAEVICQNRRSSTAVMGSQEWWKNVYLTSPCRNQRNHLTLGRDSLDCLNDYFGQLCYDDNYTRPTDVRIAEVGEAPEISERLVWNSLTGVKKKATGPDDTPS